VSELKLKGRKLFKDGALYAEIVGWRQYTDRHGPTGPGYTVKYASGGQSFPFAYFADAVTVARLEARKIVQTA